MVSFRLKLDERERTSHVDTREKNIPRRGTSKFKVLLTLLYKQPHESLE